MEKKIARVRGVIALASTAASSRKPPSAAQGTRTSVAPEALSVASYVTYIGSRAMTSSPALSKHIEAANKAFCAPAATITLAACSGRSITSL
ncbi:hypothetical protein D3C84_982340 [compost metagenome]